eukprot:TRINITY_DN3335_c0_g3_i1.p1 TRINITY_DN3335_c0_g3~~TRINITY_DN3335_c0_g3_i1.p1  ORF type:complete len:833 (+),score=218.37 TRINITY_DN3335_c0_g3_i1:143-2641(+)
MRVRHLQTFLEDQQLLQAGSLEALQGCRIGVDAIYWLRSIQALKDPFAVALGGVPPGVFGFVDKELELFRRHNLHPVFVFQGMAPGPQAALSNRLEQAWTEQAWSFLAQGKTCEAKKCFAGSTSRINGDLVYCVFHHLRYRGCEVLQAPYFAGAQLSHFLEQGVVHMVFGPPGFLLHGCPKVLLQVDFLEHKYEVVELDTVLMVLNVTMDQFIDVCMLAGTEYCRNYPYLTKGANQSQRFNFEGAAHLVKQSPVNSWSWSDQVPSELIKSYLFCKVLVQNSPVLNIVENTVRPLHSALPFPQDDRMLEGILGDKLPDSLYYLMTQGIISSKVPQALARGKWTDKTQPLVDTTELRALVGDVQDYRMRALGLVARHLPARFADKTIVFNPYWELQSGRVSDEMRMMKPTFHSSLCWRITEEAVQEEMMRQGVDKVDFKFCLEWHTHSLQTEGQLFKDLASQGEPHYEKTLLCLTAIAHFKFLEHLELIASGGIMTVLGNVMTNMPQHFQEPCLVAFETLKLGILNGEPFDSAADRPFPEQVSYPKQEVKSILLISRIVSLVPMRLRSDLWNATVDFDLSGFHSLVRLLKRTLRQLSEASLTSLLLEDMDVVKLLPPGFSCASPSRQVGLDGRPLPDDPLNLPALLPPFMVPRACMGIVTKYFMFYQGDAASFAEDVRQKFPCCLCPIEDLELAFQFWDHMVKSVEAIAEPLGADDLAQDMKKATELLRVAQRRLDVHPSTKGELPQSQSPHHQYQQHSQHQQPPQQQQQQQPHMQQMQHGYADQNDYNHQMQQHYLQQMMHQQQQGLVMPQQGPGMPQMMHQMPPPQPQTVLQ